MTFSTKLRLWGAWGSFVQVVEFKLFSYLVATITQFDLREKMEKLTVSEKKGKPIDYHGRYKVGMPHCLKTAGIENCKQLSSPLLAFTTQKIATHSTDIISAARVAFFWVVNATRNGKSCLQFLIPTAVFHMLLS